MFGEIEGEINAGKFVKKLGLKRGKTASSKKETCTLYKSVPNSR